MIPDPKEFLGPAHDGDVQWTHKDDLFVELTTFNTLVVADNEVFMRHMADGLTTTERKQYNHKVSECFCASEALLDVIGAYVDVQFLVEHPESAFIFVRNGNAYGLLIIDADTYAYMNDILTSDAEHDDVPENANSRLQFMLFDEKFVEEMELRELNTSQNLDVSLLVNFATLIDGQMADEEENMSNSTIDFDGDSISGVAIEIGADGRIKIPSTFAVTGTYGAMIDYERVGMDTVNFRTQLHVAGLLTCFKPRELETAIQHKLGDLIDRRVTGGTYGSWIPTKDIIAVLERDNSFMEYDEGLSANYKIVCVRLPSSYGFFAIHNADHARLNAVIMDQAHGAIAHDEYTSVLFALFDDDGLDSLGLKDLNDTMLIGEIEDETQLNVTLTCTFKAFAAAEAPAVDDGILKVPVKEVEPVPEAEIVSPVTHTALWVIAPGNHIDTAVGKVSPNLHAVLNGYVAERYSSGDKQGTSITAINTHDLTRLGIEMTDSFYAVSGDCLYLAVRIGTIPEHGGELFYTVYEIAPAAVEKMGIVLPKPTLMGEGPTLPITLLMSRDAFVKHNFFLHMVPTSLAWTKENYPRSTWNWETGEWVPIEPEAPNKKAEEVKRIQLKDVPLNTRPNRHMVRASLANMRPQLFDAFFKSEFCRGLPKEKWEEAYRQWLIDTQAIDMDTLDNMKAVDDLPDDRYVEAFVVVQQAAARVAYSNDFKGGLTTMDLYQWCTTHLGVEFKDVGRKEALLDLEGVVQEDIEDEPVEDAAPAVFVIGFDGTIVEDNSPDIGPVTPYAISTIKALIANGHDVCILADRDWGSGENIPMMEFLTANGCGDVDYASTITPNYAFVDGETKKYDYLILNSSVGASRIQISHRDDAGPTMFWASVVSQLHGTGYLSDEQVDAMQEELNEKMAELEG